MLGSTLRASLPSLIVSSKNQNSLTSSYRSISALSTIIFLLSVRERMIATSETDMLADWRREETERRRLHLESLLTLAEEEEKLGRDRESRPDGDVVLKSIQDLLEAVDEIALCSPPVENADDWIQRGLLRAAKTLVELLETVLSKEKLTEDDERIQSTAVNDCLLELERQLDFFHDSSPQGVREIRKVYESTVSGAMERARKRRWIQTKKAASLLKRALPTLPLIFGASVLSIWCGTLDSTRHFLRGEILSTFMNGQGGDWRKWVWKLLLSEIAATLAVIARDETSRAGKERFVRTLKVDLFAAVLRQDITFFEREDLYETRHLISNADFVCGGMLSMPSDLVEGLAKLATAVALLYKQNRSMAAFILLVALPARRFVAYALDRFQTRYERASGAGMTPQISKFTDIWSILIDPVGMKTMRSFARERVEVRDFAHAQRAREFAEAKGLAAYRFINPLRDLSDKMLDVVGIYFGGRLVMGGEMRAADLPPFVSLASDTFDRARFMQAQLRDVATSFLEPAERMYNLLERTPSIGVDVPAYASMPRDEEDFPFSIEFQHVDFGYETNNGNLTLRDVSFSVEAGQRVGIMGPSGCGKSTVFSLLTRLYDANAGRILIGGRLIQDFNPVWLRERIILVSQSSFMARRTVLDNLLYGRKGADAKDEAASEEEIKRALTIAQCTFLLHDKERFPKGLLTDLGKNASAISGGERQRLALARALLCKPAPRVLLLDEHTSALDEDLQREVQKSLDAIWRESKITVLSIAHRLSNFKDVDKCLVFDAKGTIQEQGSPSELLRLHPNGIFAGFLSTSKVDFARMGAPVEPPPPAAAAV